MLEKLDIKKILYEFLEYFENPKFITFLTEVDTYEEVETFCESLSLHIIEFKSQESESKDAYQNNSSTR